jgi:hypothetical protein
MVGPEFDGWEDHVDKGKTSNLVCAIRRMDTHPGEDYQVWENMGDMDNDEIINIPQLQYDPSKDSSSFYPNEITKLLDATIANYKKPCKDMEMLLKAAELKCKRAEAFLVKLRAKAEQNRVQAT